MTNGIAPPSAIAGDTLKEPSWGAALRLVLPAAYFSPPAFTDLQPWWTPRRDWQLSATVDKESMWGAAVARTATKFAAHGYTFKDAEASQRRIGASQELLKRANGGEGWVPFALKVVQDLLTCDNGIFIRVRRTGEKTEKVRMKAAEGDAFTEAAVTTSAPGARISGLYHLDSWRCMRTGNLAYPVRYQAVDGSYQLLRWDQVLTYADMPSPRAEMYGVGRCAAGRCYMTIAKLAAMEQLVYEFLTGGGAHKLAFVQGLNEATLKGIIDAGKADNQAKGLLYYLGTIIGAIPSDTPVNIAELQLKQLLPGFVPKDERDNAYLIYANSIGVPVQDIQPLSGQGLGTGTQTVVLQDAAKGVGIAAFIKWWEQTVSDRVLPASTELQFIDENDLRDQKDQAEVRKTRADTRKVQIDSGEISPAMARQLAADVEDIPREWIETDATPGSTLSDDEKPQDGMPNAAALQLLLGAPQTPPKPQQATATKDVDDDAAMLLEEELASARRLAREARKHG